METNPPWNWRWTALKTTKMMLVRPLLPISRRLSADCTVSACSPLPQSVKALALWLPARGAWPLDRCPPPPLTPTLSHQHPKESKLSFPPTWPLYWLLRREQPDPNFGHITLMCVCLLASQTCPTLCDLMDCSPPGLSVHGILQTRILEWVDIPYSKGSSRPRDQTHISFISCIGR